MVEDLGTNLMLRDIREGAYFRVKPDFERIVLGWEGTNQIFLFLTLTAPTRNYKKDEYVFVVQMTIGPVPQKQETNQALCSISHF